VPVVDRACADAGVSLDEIDAVGVTYAPGLIGALLVGVCFAKAAAYARGIPVIAVHHMEGHLFAQTFENAGAVPPFTALLVSGGHTMLIDVEAWGQYRLLGRTRDDAAGEAFDKVAKLLGLPYPGGPHLEKLARDGDTGRYRFTRPMLQPNQTADSPDYYDVSFSGLKTAVRREVHRLGEDLAGARADLARGFQDSLIETLVEKTARAAIACGRTRIVIGGGVACNGALRAAMSDRAARFGASVYVPSPRFATDNAAMIARAALFRFERREVAAAGLNAYASRELPGLAS
jgi:N6-L-threonylcarbamoyladenine synthase